MSKLNISLIFLLILSLYYAYNCGKSEKQALKKADNAILSLENFRKNSDEVKKLSLNLIEIIKSEQIKTDNLRNDIDNGLVELRVKVETAERNSTTASNAANKAVRLAKDVRQDYYNLRSAISYNKAVIEGWQQYYCTVIAPQNDTKFMCKIN